MSSIKQFDIKRIVQRKENIKITAAVATTKKDHLLLKFQLISSDCCRCYMKRAAGPSNNFHFFTGTLSPMRAHHHQPATGYTLRPYSFWQTPFLKELFKTRMELFQSRATSLNILDQNHSSYNQPFARIESMSCMLCPQYGFDLIGHQIFCHPQKLCKTCIYVS